MNSRWFGLLRLILICVIVSHSISFTFMTYTTCSPVPGRLYQVNVRYVTNGTSAPL